MLLTAPRGISAHDENKCPILGGPPREAAASAGKMACPSAIFEIR